jgi:hydroxypyruvate reductase
VKDLARRVFRETLAAIDIRAAIERKLARQGTQIKTAAGTVDLTKFDRVVAIAFGKAAFAMAEGLSFVLGAEFAVEGILVVPEAPLRALPGWQTYVGGHPVPTVESFQAGKAILDCLSRCHWQTLIFFLISGGGSALVEYPLDESVSIEDFQSLHAALVTCGASIEEINSIRKHVSATKGGRLAAAAPNSTKITLAISDVPLGAESAIASGPTLPDPSRIGDVSRTVREYGIVDRVPQTFRRAIEGGKLAETPKKGSPAFARSSFALLLSEHDLFHAAHRACEAEGFFCLCDNSTDNWRVRDAAHTLFARLETQRSANPGRPVAVIADGEVSSPVTGKGLGGRNAAFVLACVEEVAGRGITVLSAGTDGIDGNSPAAGAVADGETLQRTRSLGLDPREYEARSDAYSLFAALGDAIVTGPTGNNLRDLRILLAP